MVVLRSVASMNLNRFFHYHGRTSKMLSSLATVHWEASNGIPLRKRTTGTSFALTRTAREADRFCLQGHRRIMCMASVRGGHIIFRMRPLSAVGMAARGAPAGASRRTMAPTPLMLRR